MRGLVERPNSSEINETRKVLETVSPRGLEIYNQLIDYVHSLEGPLPDSDVGFSEIETETCVALANFYDKPPEK
tara:strand:- start:554 stop:775 length:222 start_codon:yes stop_codon:yes gene_type:complete